jgi:hypothetical protein
MPEGIGIPVLISPFGARLIAVLDAESARELLEISGGGSGVPDGGAAGDFLVKRTATNGDVEFSPVVDAGYY